MFGGVSNTHNSFLGSEILSHLTLEIRMVESGGFDIQVWAIKCFDFEMEPKRAVYLKKKNGMDSIPKLPYLIYSMIKQSLNS